MLWTNFCKEHLDEVLQFANKINKEHQLLQCLWRVSENFNHGKPYVCIIGKDFAAYSFTFACYKLDDVEIITDNGTFISRKYGSDPFLNGGIIYHGPHDKADKETFNIQLSPSDGWSIHT